MKLMILDGIPKDHPYAPYSDIITQSVLNNKHHRIDSFRLRDMKLQNCTGCWSCWYKTPGRCPIKDDAEQIVSRIPHMDMILYITPVIAGYESALIKTIKDRSIPIAHPYITIRDGEQHHYERYEKSPDVSVLTLTDASTTGDDLSLIRETYHRVGLNMGNDTIKVYTSDTIKGGIDHVLNHI